MCLAQCSGVADVFREVESIVEIGAVGEDIRVQITAAYHTPKVVSVDEISNQRCVLVMAARLRMTLIWERVIPSSTSSRERDVSVQMSHPCSLGIHLSSAHSSCRLF